ncbi:MAG: PEP-CTERM sorting domain-containing protein [Planctomycetota bacterium]
MKLMAIAAVAGFAGLATASPFISTTTTSTENASAPAGAVQTVTVDISGVNSWDFQGASVNEIISVNIGGDFLVTGIGWDVNLSTIGASWLSETTLGFLDSGIGLQVTPGIGDDFTGSASYSSGGILDLAAADPTFPFSAGADGIVQIEVFESFDDVSGAIDNVFGAGSTLQIQFVPAPGALAMLGLGGLVAGRRRR